MNTGRRKGDKEGRGEQEKTSWKETKRPEETGRDTAERLQQSVAADGSSEQQQAAAAAASGRSSSSIRKQQQQ